MKRLIALSALAFAGYASGQPGAPYKGTYDGWYAGASIGQTSVDIDGSAFQEINDTDTGWKLYMGYRFLRYFALEGAYAALGESSVKSPAISLKTEVNDTLYLAAVGMLPLGDRFVVFGKVGIFSAETDAVACVLGACANENERQDGWMYGVGLDFFFARQWGVRAEWERFTNVGSDQTPGNKDVDLISVGVIYRF